MPARKADLPSSGLEDAAPHYHGHRERLRARFREAGADALADYELLELVLFRAIPQRDVKPIAKELIARTSSTGDRRQQTLSLKDDGRTLVPKLAELAYRNDAEFFGHRDQFGGRFLFQIFKMHGVHSGIAGAIVGRAWIGLSRLDSRATGGRRSNRR